MNEENFYGLVVIIGLLGFCIGTVIIRIILKLKYNNEMEKLKEWKKVYENKKVI